MFNFSNLHEQTMLQVGGGGGGGKLGWNCSVFL